MAKSFGLDKFSQRNHGTTLHSEVHLLMRLPEIFVRPSAAIHTAAHMLGSLGQPSGSQGLPYAFREAIRQSARRHLCRHQMPPLK
jgi:hypothetical protein